MSEVNFISTKTGKKIRKKSLLVKWLNKKLKQKEWADHEISKAKYEVSFVPLVNKDCLKKQEYARNLGISYGVMRKFLSEKRVKKLAEEHAEGFSRFFCDKLALEFKNTHMDKKPSGHTRDRFTIEMGVEYSELVIGKIIEKLQLQIPEPSSAWFGLTVVRNSVLNLLGTRFKDVGKKKMYLMARVRYLYELSILMEGCLGVVRDGIKKETKENKPKVLHLLNGCISLAKQYKEVTVEMNDEIKKMRI